MNTESKSVYIHIPFCKTICSYCDFCKVFYNGKWAYEYLECLEREIEDTYNNEEIESIYIGGGTPSALPIKYLEKLFKILKIFHIKQDAENTFECNLNDITKDLLEVLKKNHINRLSIGIQSFHEEKLRHMGRSHTIMEAKEKIALCRSMGFNNINIDFIYGFAFEDKKMVKEDLKQILNLKPEHISSYSLQLESGTLLYLNKTERLNDDDDAELYEFLCNYLTKKGYLHYEISNFAQKGYASKHNLRYWQNKEYYGFGLSASGYLDKVRYTNTRSLTKYLKGEFNGEKELLTKQDVMDNHLMLGFRLTNGFNVAEFERLYNVNLSETYPIKPLLKNKDLMLKKGNIFINPDKLYIMNEILLKMI